MAINFNHITNEISYIQETGDQQFYTGAFVRTSDTGIFVSNSKTGDFITTAQTGSFASLNGNYLKITEIPTISGDVCINAGTDIATVTKIQGYPVSNAAPAIGQTMQFDGTYWQPGAVPAGGNGGGGLVYYFNASIDPDSPTAGITTGEFGLKELGRSGISQQTSITSSELTQDVYTKIISFVSDVLDPDATAIPAGLFDMNIWMSSDATVATQMALQIKLYKYNGSTATLIATSDDISIYDPTVPAQYIASIVVPQTEIQISDRLLIELNAKTAGNKKRITLKFGGSTPSHIHTTIPSVGGSGLVKVINGIMQNPASKLVDADIDPSAQISASKIENGVFALAENTGSFITSNQTGNFITNNQTGIFVTTNNTGNFITTNQTGQFGTLTSESKFALNSEVLHRNVDVLNAGNLMSTFSAVAPTYLTANSNILTPLNTGWLTSLKIGSPITATNLTNATVCSIDLVAGNFCITSNASATTITNVNRFPSTPYSLVSAPGTKTYDSINSCIGLSLVLTSQTVSAYNGPWIVCQTGFIEASSIAMNIASGSNIVNITSIGNGSIIANGTRSLYVSSSSYGTLMSPISAIGGTGTGTYLLSSILPSAANNIAAYVGIEEVFTRPYWFSGTAVTNGILTTVTRNNNNGATYSTVGINNTTSTGINVGYDPIGSYRVYTKSDSPTLAANLYTNTQTFVASNTGSPISPFRFQAGAVINQQGLIIHTVDWDGQHIYTTTPKNELVVIGNTAGTITSITLKNSDESTTAAITSGTITIAAGATTTGIASQITTNINNYYTASNTASNWSGFLSGSTIYLSSTGKMIGATPTIAGTAAANISTSLVRKRVLILEEQVVAPLSSSFPGNKGAIYADSSFLYFCVEKNTWRRVGLSSF